MSTRVLVTGSAGFIGKNLAAQLRQSGFAVHCIDHLDQAESTKVDLNDLGALRQYLAETAPEFVIHLGARTDLHGTTLADYTANTRGVENLIAACNECPSIRRVLFASSRMVCRIDYIPKTYEDYCPPNAYGESKVLGEKLVRSAKTNFEWTIFRPTSIWGPHFAVPYRTFFDQIRSGRYFHPGSANPRKSFGYVGNSVFQLEKLMLAPAAKIHGRTFYLGDYTPMRIREWANLIAVSFTPPRKIRTAPMAILWPAAWIGDGLDIVKLRDKYPLTSFRLNNLLTEMVYPQLTELQDVTGPLPFSLEAGTVATVRWMEANDRT